VLRSSCSAASALRQRSSTCHGPIGHETTARALDFASVGRSVYKLERKAVNAFPDFLGI
jgi:hypothetical protein